MSYEWALELNGYLKKIKLWSWWIINMDNELVDIIFQSLILPFLKCRTFFCYPLFWLRSKASLTNRKSVSSNLRISTPCHKFQPSFESQTLLGANISCWDLGTILLLAPTSILLGLEITVYSWRFLWGIPLCFFVGVTSLIIP